MKYINKSKPIKFSLLVGGRECRSVEDVKRNFDLGSLCKNFDNGNLQKWLKQIGESSLLNRIDALLSADLLTKKVCLYNIFSSEPLSSDEVNEDNVLKLMKNGCIKFDDLSSTHFANSLEIKKSIIDCTDNENINSLCESDLEFLKYVYSKKSYDNLNATNCRTLINQKIVTNEDLIMEIASYKNLDDILKHFGTFTVTVGNVSIEMILVKGYYCGDFYIGKYPVTQAQWQAVMGYNPSESRGENNPVENVSWNECQKFVNELCAKTGRKFRFPKWAEWGYAARGGKKDSDYEFSGSSHLHEVGWYSINSYGKTHPVGLKKPNELGIYDMSGNVWEWCDDLSSDRNRHLLHGGSWDDDFTSCYVSTHDSAHPEFRSNKYGFRLALSV